RTLKNALASGRIAHAYLFAGPRGIGKTTTARLLARALLCAERNGSEPCGRCEVCTDAQPVDLIEIDAASNRRIDDVRTLRENVKYAPSRGRYKIYIVDEVHQLTADSFDALLKTLEEPPPHVVFILATTDPRDLPPTILSRVQRFDFRPIAPEALTASLERILKEEKVAYEPDALPAVVRASEGSLRDALSLLDTAIAYGNGTLEAETTAQLLGATAPKDVRVFCRALLTYDTVAAVEAIDRAVREGDDVQAFTRDAIELLRRVLVLKAAPAAKMADLAPVEADELRALGEAVSLDEALYVVRAFLDADMEMRESPHPRIELEIAAIRATRRPVAHELATVIKRVDDALARAGGALVSDAPATSAGTAGRPAAARPASPAPPARPSFGGPPPSGSRPAGAPPPPPAGSRADAPPRAPAVASTSAAPPAPPTDDLAVGWQRVIEDVQAKRAMVGAILGQARPLGVTNGELALALTVSQFQRDLLADHANREIVMQAIRKSLTGVTAFTFAADTGGGSGSGSSGGGPTSHPAVQAAIAELGGEVVAVRPRREGEGQ
ncbi:MAG TPA: DNA polymerase III subunit gamma/tau, partial [Terriglobales bacterium]|nr:DNA polymerase III subunit gamma/tau [Terriglobales bacterium]